MVESTLYVPNKENTTWRVLSSGKQAKRGKHAELAAYDSVGPKTEANVFMFVQDAAPCENCHPYFRKESSESKRSFIFCISGGGYVVFLDLAKGDRIGGMHLPVAGQKAKDAFIKQINMNGWVKLTDDQLPAVIYFHGGSVFLDAKPIDFPDCPSLLAGYG